MTLVQQNLCRIIEEKGYRKGFVARKAGLTPQQLSDMIHGRKTIQADHIPRLAEATEVPIEEFFKDPEEERKEGEQ